MVGMERRWNGPAQVKALGDDPTQAQINALFAIPGDSKSDSALPHHTVSGGKVGAADKDGCIAAIGALNGSRGGVQASAAEKAKAYSHLASHLRAMGETPPEKQFAAVRDLELRAQRRRGMLRVPERIALQFGASGVEMRAKANGTGGTKFCFTGYAAVYDYPFQMWDFWGDEFSEKVGQRAGARTLANRCDVPFLVGHNDAGIPMARTKSGTMRLGEDTHGLHVDAPDLDGSLEQIRQLASAVERGDMDEMSMAFMTLQQDWSPDYSERTILEYDLHKGDVSVVVFGANDGTAGSSMVALPAEQLLLRRPTGIRQLGASEQRMPTAPYTVHDGETNECPQCHSMNDDTASYCDQCGTAVQPAGRVSNMAGVEDMTQACTCGRWNSSDAKYCGGCGQELAGDQGASMGYWSRQRRSGGLPAASDYSDAPDYDPAPHAAEDAIHCPSPDCTVEGGALNAPDAKHCDQCGAPLYDEDGKIVTDDLGVPTEIEGDASQALALRRRQLELLSLSA
jgi:HK97 family phage prohead protease